MATTNKSGKQTSKTTANRKASSRSSSSARKPASSARKSASKPTSTARKSTSKPATASRRPAGKAATTSRRSATKPATTSRPSASKPAASSNGSSSNGSVAVTIARNAVGALVGGAAVGVAGVLASRRTKPKVLGIAIPDELNPQRLDVKKLASQLDLKDVIRHIGNFAEQVEARSEDVRSLSAQAKRLSRRMT
jgi:hypothetical protein